MNLSKLSETQAALAERIPQKKQIDHKRQESGY